MATSKKSAPAKPATKASAKSTTKQAPVKQAQAKSKAPAPKSAAKPAPKSLKDKMKAVIAKVTSAKAPAKPVTSKPAPTKPATAKTKPAKPSAKPAAKASTPKPAPKAEVKAEAKVKVEAKAEAKPAARPTAKQAPAATKAASPAPAAQAPAAKAARPANAAAKAAAPQAQAAAPAQPAPAQQAPAPKKLRFKAEEFVVYPAHGVGKIVDIEEQEIAGAKLELYVIDFLKEKMRLRVPTGKAESVGMRKLADKPLVEQGLRVLKGRAKIKRTMWSRRAQEYEAKINSGDLIAVAEVVRDLFRSDRQPEQSYSERQLYEAALDRMAREIAAVRKVSDEEAVAELEGILDKTARKNEKAAEDAAAEKAA